MARHTSGVGDSPERLDEDRSKTGAGKPVRLRFLTRAQAGLVGLVLLAPLVPTGGSTPEPTWELRAGCSALVQAVAITDDGRRIAVAAEAGGVVLWEVGQGIETDLSGSPACKVASLAFSRDGAIVAAARRDGKISLWDTVTGRLRVTLSAQADTVLCLAFSPDGSQLATGSVDESIRLWDVGTWKVTSVLRGHNRPVCGVRFSPDGRVLASVSSDGLVNLWDVAGGEGRERHHLRLTAPRF